MNYRIKWLQSDCELFIRFIIEMYVKTGKYRHYGDPCWRSGLVKLRNSVVVVVVGELIGWHIEQNSMDLNRILLRLIYS